MYELLTQYPWLGVCGLVAAVIVACVAIVFITDYLHKAHQSEIDATLKRDMLDRGMSAADIKTVLEAASGAEEMRLALGQRDQGVRLGLGKLRLEVGTIKADAPVGNESQPARS